MEIGIAAIIAISFFIGYCLSVYQNENNMKEDFLKSINKNKSRLK